MTDLTRVTGIGPDLASQLTAAGVPDAEALAEARPADIISVRGIGASTAPILIARSKQVTAPTPDPESQPDTDALQPSAETMPAPPSEETVTRKKPGKKEQAGTSKKTKNGKTKDPASKSEKKIKAKVKKAARKADKAAEKAAKKAEKKSGKAKTKAKKSAQQLKRKAEEIRAKAEKKVKKIRKKAAKFKI